MGFTLDKIRVNLEPQSSHGYCNDEGKDSSSPGGCISLSCLPRNMWAFVPGAGHGELLHFDGLVL